MIPTNPRLGNCYLGAWYLKRHHDAVSRKIRPKSGGPRHVICKLPNGEWWHFKRIRDVLPWPLNNVLFWGRFEMMERRDTNASK